MNITAIVQARMGSSRLPNKVMASIVDTPLIELLLLRLARSKNIDDIVLATSVESENQNLVSHVEGLGYQVFRGSEDDVLDRFYNAAIAASSDGIVRITGDCPLVDPELVDRLISEFSERKVDYVSNISPPTYPDGLDTEVFTFDALKEAWILAENRRDREHVTPFIRESGRFSTWALKNVVDLSRLRWTVDEAEDLEVIRRVFEHYHPRKHFRWKEVVDLTQTNAEIFSGNANLNRNYGEEKGSGQKLWGRAKRVIPGGNMLLSKRPDMFSPEDWPTYFDKARGCSLWDLDGKKYIDMSIMGVGTNMLGYAQSEIDAAVGHAVSKGNMSSLNCPEEVYLAEKLVALHPWADMVRFARTGGEANAVAIRIARAAVGKDKVAVCGYHGWHDWYLSANLGNTNNLEGHLLPGLEARGVPGDLRNTVFPFEYNKFSQLESIVSRNDIGVIKMEVSRSAPPKEHFLDKVRKLASDRGIVLIFDECTSGFREANGGLHLKYGVDPDMAVFGKALGNGYAITAIIGKREIMESAQSTFISSTFWTERIGPVAALKTLEVMEQIKAWEFVTLTGEVIRANWIELAKKHGLALEHWGIPALAGFTMKGDQSLAYKTLITQEMLSKGYLASNCVYVCTEHTAEVISGYIDALDSVFGLIRECEDGRDVLSLLNGPICNEGFTRLN